MQSSRLAIQQIYQYLSARNFNLSSEKVLRDPHAYGDIIWNILNFLAMGIRDQVYEQLEPSLIYLLDGDTHRNSLKRMREYITVSNVLKKLGYSSEYPFKQILKPDKELLYEKISRLIHANRFHEKLSKDFEHSILTEQNLKEEIRILRLKDTDLRQEIEETKVRKEKEKDIYEEKVQNIENLNKEISYKKKEKMDLLVAQQDLEKEIHERKKIHADLIYQKEDSDIRIKRLEREIIQNAPKLKKERMQLMAEHQSFDKVVSEDLTKWQFKAKYLKQTLSELSNIKNKSKTSVIEMLLEEKKQNNEERAIEQNIRSNQNDSLADLKKQRKQLFQNIQNQEKRKRELNEIRIDREGAEKGTRSDGMKINEQVRRYEEVVRALEEKRRVSIEQGASLLYKIRHKKENYKQRFNELETKIKQLNQQAQEIVEQAFSEF